MLCCVCKEQEASVHLSQVQEGTTQTKDFCEECARKKGLNNPAGIDLAQLLSDKN
jgi:protein arginine kinase activator